MTIAGLMALAVLDSVNPSAIAVTLYLLSIATSGAHVKVAVYISTIFVTYFALGVMMVLGIDALVPALADVLGSRTGLVAQTLIGLALLVYSLTASTARTPSQAVSHPSAGTYAALAALGVSVTAMELPTAIPYFAAVALITEAKLPIQAWAPLLGMYNVMFVLPPIALLAGHVVFGKRLGETYATLRQRLQKGAQETMLWVAGLVGGGLFVTGMIELAARLP